MDGAVILAGLIIAAPLALSLLAVVAARLSRPDERYILKFATVAAGIAFVVTLPACPFELDSQAVITVRNETPWVVTAGGQYTQYTTSKDVQPNSEEDFDIFLGPGQETLIASAFVLLVGPDLSSRVVVNGDSADSGMTITVRPGEASVSQ
jgi:hypothetical protein